MKNFRINRQPIHQILITPLIEIKKVMGGLFLEVVGLLHCIGVAENETFQKCSILFKSKAGENFNHRHT
jgi:hypothetical protein